MGAGLLVGGVVAGLAACLGLVYGLARFEDIMRARSLRRRARAAVAERSPVDVLADIDRRIDEIDAEVAKLRRSAGAYSAIGSGMGGVASLFKEQRDLEEYRQVVAKLTQ